MGRFRFFPMFLVRPSGSASLTPEEKREVWAGFRGGRKFLNMAFALKPIGKEVRTWTERLPSRDCTQGMAGLNCESGEWWCGRCRTTPAL